MEIRLIGIKIKERSRTSQRYIRNKIVNYFEFFKCASLTSVFKNFTFLPFSRSNGNYYENKNGASQQNKSEIKWYYVWRINSMLKENTYLYPVIINNLTADTI